MKPMGMKQSNGEKKSWGNLPVRVTGFVEKDGAVGVKGVNLNQDSGEEVSVFLTDRGKAAETPNRPSLEKLKEGFKIGRNKYRLEEGGIMSFKAAFPTNKEKTSYMAQWPNVLAYNAQDAKSYVGHANHALLDLRENNGRHYGTVFSFNPREDKHIKGQSGSDIKDQVEEVAQNSVIPPAFLVRFCDNEGQVVDYQMIVKQYNKDEDRPMNAEEMGEYLASYVDYAQNEKFEGQNLNVNVLPAQRYIVSPKSLNVEEGEKSSLDFFKNVKKSFVKELENGEIDIVAKEAWMKLGGDNGEFVNSIHVNEPFGEGVDPVLIGGLRYAPGFQTEEGPTQDTAQETETTPAPPQADGDVDPFEALEGQNFEEESPAPF